MVKIVNYYTKVGKGLKNTYYNPVVKDGGLMFPMRVGIFGSSGGGKSNCLLNLINYCKCFSKIFIYTRTEEPLYDLISDKYGEDFSITDNTDQLPKLKSTLSQDEESGKEEEEGEEDPDHQKLIVFDDFIAESIKIIKQITKYFIYGRKPPNNFSCVCISQSYFAVPRPIKLQLTYMIFTRATDVPEMKRIMRERNINLNISPSKIVEAMIEATKNKFDVFCIDLATNDPKKMFAKNFNEYITIE